MDSSHVLLASDFEIKVAHASPSGARGVGVPPSRVAEQLILSSLTAETHVAQLFLRYGARAQVVIAAYETGAVGI